MHADEMFMVGGPLQERLIYWNHEVKIDYTVNKIVKIIRKSIKREILF